MRGRASPRDVGEIGAACGSVQSVWQGGEALFDPLRRDARQASEFGARLRPGLHDARDHRGRLAVVWLASKFEADTVWVIKIDSEQPRELWDRPNIVDTARYQPRLDLAEALGGDDECAMLHGPDRVAVAGGFLAFRDLEERQKAVITHIKEVMTHPLIGWVAAIAGPGAETGRHLHGMNERHAQYVDIEVDRCLHVLGAECQVMDASWNG